MERWIANAWRVFWVGLGASAVLVAQAVLPGSPSSGSTPSPAPVVAPSVEGLKMGPLARPLHETKRPDAPSISKNAVPISRAGARLSLPL